MTLGDGAAYCVLENASAAFERQARIRAAITGYACVGEGYHSTAPDPTGEGLRKVMLRTLQMDPDPSSLRYVSAHGTGTPANDEAEVHAIESILEHFDIHGPVSVASLKSQIGHALGAAGASLWCSVRDRPVRVALGVSASRGPMGIAASAASHPVLAQTSRIGARLSAGATRNAPCTLLARSVRDSPTCCAVAFTRRSAACVTGMPLSREIASASAAD